MELLFTGDFYPTKSISHLIESNNFREMFNAFLDISRQVDISVTNLECPLTKSQNPNKPTGPALKGNPLAARFLKSSGFNLVTLANNHIMDYGDDGINETFQHLIDSEIAYVGAGKNNFDARKPFIFEKENIKIGILAIAENEWGTTFDNNPGAAPINLIDNFTDISKLKELVDCLVLVVHGGLELYSLPTPFRKRLLHHYIDVGADIIIGHHSHYFSGYEIYKGKPIFYSLGNFVFDRAERKSKLWNTGFAVKLMISKNDVEFEIVPFEQNYRHIGIHLLSGSDRTDFFDEINRLNSIIYSDELLKAEFEKEVLKQKKKYLRYIQPYNSAFLLGLFNRQLLPNIWSKSNRNLLVNLIKSETHKEMLLNILES